MPSTSLRAAHVAAVTVVALAACFAVNAATHSDWWVVATGLAITVNLFPRVGGSS